MSSNRVLECNQVDVSKILLEDFVPADKEVVSTLWYETPSKFSNLLIQTNWLKVSEATENYVEVLPDQPLHDLCQQVDAKAYEFIKSSKVIKQHGTKEKLKDKQEEKKYQYQSTISEPAEGKTVLRVKVLDDTKLYVSGDKSSHEYSTLMNSVKRNEVKLILELESLVMNNEKKILFVKLLLRQVLLRKMFLREELTGFSFVGLEEFHEPDRVVSTKDLLDEHDHDCDHEHDNIKEHVHEESSEKVELDDDASSGHHSVSSEETKNILRSLRRS